MHLFLFDKTIFIVKRILPVLQYDCKAQRPLFIVVEIVDNAGFAALVVNKFREGIHVAAVKTPGFGDHRKVVMQDLAILTAAKLVNENTGMKSDEKFN